MEPPPQAFDALASTSACLLGGSVPGLTAAQLAPVILSCARECAAWELACVSMSLVAKIARVLESGKLAAGPGRFWEGLLRLLWEERLPAVLVERFQSRDPLVSHLAAKAVSCWAVRDIRRGEGAPPAWLRTCERTFLSGSVRPGLDACLWSTTDVCKKLLTGAPPEVLENLLAELQPSVSAACSALLPDGLAPGTTLCLLLDLLEVLMAPSLPCGDQAGPGMQNPGWAQWPRLLAAVGSSSLEQFVQRRALLLLKRGLLLTAGEEWTARGGRPPPDPISGLGAVARSVLAAVDAGWLDSIQVGSHTFFGGSRASWGGGADRRDEVLLRGVGLVLLRSVHVSVHADGGVGGASGPRRYLQRLWAFVRRWTPPHMQVQHLCCYLGLLFGEQDDDLMEAARSLLSIFLGCRGGWDLDGSWGPEAACSLGCNPHCHFVLLLRSFSFDHSLLLDFLICSETCFLEYLVRYLRYLRKDWRGLAAACGASEEPQRSVSGGTGGALSPRSGSVVKATPAGSGSSATESGSPITGSSSSAMRSSLSATESGLLVPGFGWPTMGSPSPTMGSPSLTTGSPSPTTGSPSPTALRLVDYDSSDDSAAEEEGSPVPTPAGWSQPPAGPVERGLLDRTVLCLSELRRVVLRLHSRKLFPYNPSSLLRLLADVEAVHGGAHRTGACT